MRLCDYPCIVCRWNVRIRDQAFEGSDYGKETSESGSISYTRIAFVILAFIALMFVTNRNSSLKLTKTEDYELTTKGAELEKDIHKYANYLRDFSLLNEHEAINVKIWDQIMIWAALLGLTDVVQEQFKKIYPNYGQETVYSGSSIFYASIFSSSTASARTPSSSSSGGGGYSSSDGGSGGGTR